MCFSMSLFVKIMEKTALFSRRQSAQSSFSPRKFTKSWLWLAIQNNGSKNCLCGIFLHHNQNMFTINTVTPTSMRTARQTVENKLHRKTEKRPADSTVSAIALLLVDNYYMSTLNRRIIGLCLFLFYCACWVQTKSCLVLFVAPVVLKQRNKQVL